MSGVVGEAHCDTEGVLHGWCWSAQAPAARLQVELVVCGKPVRSVVASRFREDLRERGVGDGYHGFFLILPPAVLTPNGVHAAVRDVGTGTVFWQANALTLTADPALTAEIDELRRTVARLAGELAELGEPRRLNYLVSGICQLAQRLRLAADHGGDSGQ